MAKIKYFTTREISLHISPGDLWVSLFGKVLDLSPLFKDRPDAEKEFPLLAFSGKDVSHFFDEHGEVKLHVDPNTNKISAFFPFQSLLDAPSEEEAGLIFAERRQSEEKIASALMQRYMDQRLSASSNYTSILEVGKQQQDCGPGSIPWWRDEKYVIGLLTCKPRWIKILNTLIMKEVTLEVCSEETLEEILDRYLKFNCHANSYTWKYLGDILEMRQTLEMNGIPDHDEEADRLRLKSEDFIPTLTIHFNDDLTEM